MRIHANIWHLIGRLNQPAADGFLPLRAFKPSSSESADRGRSIIQVSDQRERNIWYDWIIRVNFTLNKGNNKITELRTILQRESQNS